MTEREGCQLLRHRFEAAGLSITERHALAVGDATIEVDGFDPERRVGYEYITTEAGDRAGITPAIVDELERQMVAGDLFLLLVDERDVPSPAVLERAADGFLAALRARGHLA